MSTELFVDDVLVLPELPAEDVLVFPELPADDVLLLTPSISSSSWRRGRDYADVYTLGTSKTLETRENMHLANGGWTGSQRYMLDRYRRNRE